MKTVGKLYTIFLSLPLFIAALYNGTAAKPSPDDSALGARIAHIENNLVPGVIIKGQQVPSMKVTDRMHRFRAPGMSVAFIDHGKIAWTRVYGFADVASKTPVTPNTLFQAASISKPVTAMAAMRLVQEGKLNLDEDVNLEMTAWKVPENSFTTEQKVTLRRLLSHTAGLTTPGFAGYTPKEPLPSVFQILDGEKPANSPPVRVDVVPGTIWRYSGGGYVVIRLLLSDVTHKNFERIVDDLVLRPIGMTHSTFQQPLPKNLWSEAATGYLIDGQPLPDRFNIMPELGPDGMWSTPSDVARFAIEVQSEYAGSSRTILSQAAMREMLGRQKDNYSLGFEIEPPGHTSWFGHGGSDRGFKSRFQTFTESGGQGIVIMTNGDGGGHVRNEYIRAVAKEYGWPDYHQPREHVVAKISSQVLPEYTGAYKVADGRTIHVILKNDRLYLDAIPFDLWGEELFPESESQFFILSDDSTFTFERNEQGKVDKLLIQVGSNTSEAPKVS